VISIQIDVIVINHQVPFNQNPEPSDDFEYKIKKARPRAEIIVKTKFWFITR